MRNRLTNLGLSALGLLVASLASPLLAQSSPSSFTTGFRFDQARQLRGVIHPDPDGGGPLRFAATRNTYDGNGLLTSVEDGELLDWQSEAVAPSAWSNFTVHKVTRVTYDRLDRKTRETVSENSGTVEVVRAVTQYSYDSEGRLVCTAVRLNSALWNSQPDACVPQLDPNNPDRITQNVYDPAGRLVQMREGVGAGREVAEATYSYTDNGKREYVIDAAGNRAKLVYDAFDRQLEWIFPSATKVVGYSDLTQTTALSTAGAINTADREEYTYDPNGNRKTLRKRDGRVLTFNYDALNRMTSKVVPEGCPPIAPPTGQCPQTWATPDVFYAYNLLGGQTEARFGSAAGTDRVINSYNGFGELISSEINMGGIPRTLTHHYDANGNSDRLTHADNQLFTYAYDGLDRLSGLYQGTANPLGQFAYNSQSLPASRSEPAGSTVAYTWDKVGRLTGLTDTFTGGTGNVARTFGYNAASQVALESRNNDAYAWTGSVAVNRPYTTNGLNQYTAAGPASFQYDANGNLVSETGATYIYDAENRLVQASNGAELRYDPLGRLWQVTKGSQVTQFLYDGDALVAEYDGTGAMLARYVHGSNAKVDDPLVWYAGPGFAMPRWLHANHQGSIVAVTDSTGGSPTINTYDEYGIPNLQFDPNMVQYNANHGRFQYTGQAWLAEIGMYHYKARIYSPKLGRFLQTDPIGYDDQTNLYAYVGNDPVNKVDPTGRARDFWSLLPSNAVKMMVRAHDETVRLNNAVRDVPRQEKALERTAVTMAETKVASAISSRLTLSSGMQGAVDKVIRIGNNNALYKDFIGAAREQAGVLTGANHVKEMRQSIDGLNAKTAVFRDWAFNTKNGLNISTRAGLLTMAEYTSRLSARMTDTLDGE